MQAGSKTRGPKGDINVTPLVDVVLVLLIIFMVITPMLQKGAPVELPKVENPGHTSEKDSKEQVTITVNKEGAVFLETEPIGDAELLSRLTDMHKLDINKPIFVKGDNNANYGRVRAVMKMVTDAGFETVGMITKDKKDKG